jgi:hypothetical protein
MTHSLHRQGTEESLKHDYVVLAMGTGAGAMASQKARLSRKLPGLYKVGRAVYRLLRKLKPAGQESQAKKQQDQNPGIKGAAVFDSREALCDYLKMLKDADSGRSVVVSGLIDEVDGCLGEIGLKPHTVQFSLGHFGRTDLLPGKEVLEMTTMCGHDMVAPKLVQKWADDVRKGKLAKDKAADNMAKLCKCGIFNKTRALEILDRIPE